MAVVAALCDCPTTPGAVTHVPFDTTRLMGVLGGSLAPAPGLCAETEPLGWVEHAVAVVWLPTVRPAWVRRLPARAGDCPMTLGTETEVWVPETVRATFFVSGIFWPAAGFWSSTVPTGWLLVTLWMVYPRLAPWRSAMAWVSCFPVTTGTTAVATGPLL